MKVMLRLGATSQEVRVLRSGERLQVTLADGRLLQAEVENNGDGTFTVQRNGHRLECAGAVLGTERQLWLDGRTVRYRRAQPGVLGGYASDQLPMTSAIPAVVREVLVAVGEGVLEGQKLVLLESMKMVLPILASRPGRVRAILCAPGDAIAPGVPLVELEDG